MGMLTKRDLGQIGKLLDTRFDGFEKKIDKKFDESADKIIGAVGEMLEENVLPQIDEVRKDVKGIKATMVTKDYLDEKLGGLKGEMTAKHKDFDRRLRALEPKTKTPLA
jgi:hypothetical protein